MHRHHLFLVLSLLSFAIACAKDEEVAADNALPEVSFLEPDKIDTLQNEVTFRIEAKDNVGIARVEIYIEDSLLDAKMASPYDFTWNSLQKKDGDYILKVVATDKKGNQQQQELNITVRNSLIYWNEEYYFVDEDSREIMVVTDPEGKILNWKEFDSNPKFHVYPSDPYKGETINVYLIKKDPQYYNITTYLNLKRGTSWNPVPLWVPARAGTMDLNIKNANSGFDYLTYGINWGLTTTSITDTTITKFDYYNKGQIYAQIVKDNTGYYDFFNIDPTKNSFDIDFSSLKNLSTRTTVQLLESGTGYYWLWGSKTIEGNNHIYNLFERDFTGSSFDIFYPEDASLTYSSSLYYRTNGKAYSYYHPGQVIKNFDLMEVEANVINANPENFKLAFTGNFDYYYLLFTIPGFERNLQVFSSKAVTEFKLPDFSEILKLEPFGTDDLFIRELTLTDREGHTEDQDYLKYFSVLPYYSHRFEPPSIIKEVSYYNINE